jgi:hypothetical protein
VAAFAGTTLRRLFLIQFFFASVAAGTFAWFLHAACLPPLQKAVDQLPDQGYIDQQRLFTPLTNTITLVAEPVLGVIVNLPRQNNPPLPSDIQVVFYHKEVDISTRFGSFVSRYPKGWIIQFNRKEVAPALQAWTPAALAIAALAVFILLFLTWTVLASFFFLIPIVVARYSERALTLAGSWKLASAALLPGTLFLTAGLAAYGLGWIHLLHFTLLAAAHLMIGWLYLVLSPLALPRPVDIEEAENPFRPPPPAPEPDSEPEEKKNPFASPEKQPPHTPPLGASDPWEP